MNIHSSQYIGKFQQEVLDFYTENGRFSLAFRQTTNPYHIHISEVMLSQTQVLRVEDYFTKWIAIFPDITSVVTASKSELLQLWQGLGYNSRVLNFQIACRQLVAEFGGVYPQNQTQLQTLKGIGPYVSSAILAFAFNINVGVVDTNIRRILIHYGFANKDTNAKELCEIAKHLTPEGKAREWNNALMDFGALYATAHKTNITSLGKQGAFVGSMRYVRSFIIKTCLKHGSCRVLEVEQLCQKYQHNSAVIIEKLIGEGVIYVKDNTLYIGE